MGTTAGFTETERVYLYSGYSGPQEVVQSMPEDTWLSLTEFRYTSHELAELERILDRLPDLVSKGE